MQEGEGDAMELLEGFPHWELDFDEDGQTVDPDQLDKFLTDVGVQQLTDVFVFSHGWNNSRAAARDLYQRFFKEMRTILEGAHGGLRRQATIGTAGVIWPSMRWADEEAAAESTIDTGGAASVLDRAAADRRHYGPRARQCVQIASATDRARRDGKAAERAAGE